MVIVELESLSERKRIQVDCDRGLDDPLLEMDTERVGQVIRNLLSNALKFSPEGGSILLTCREAKIERAQGSLPAVRLQVKDQGPGIPEAEIESVFDKFVQSSRNDKQSGGTGLGLAISREIVIAHQGYITAFNNPDGGACFEMVLPRRRLSSEVA